MRWGLYLSLMTLISPTPNLCAWVQRRCSVTVHRRNEWWMNAALVLEVSLFPCYDYWLTWPLPPHYHVTNHKILWWLFMKWVLLSLRPLDHHSFSPLNLLQFFQTLFLLWTSRIRMFWEISVWGVGRHHSVQMLALFQRYVFCSAKSWGPVGFQPDATIVICL